ncbi:hypothetical protein [Pragia fontium]|uniref:InsA N-terminal domain-containing protein n=2 Tax=Pragia fontium TaxID=82985 RepID=A0AAJ4W805_9GAMM|nr:hypothetical protein [Pragia fontium]GKX62778.1 hypothetical protein SOASR032_13470 [Pragia fontium]SFC08523.1 hypothetical protein SAMN02745723_101342 [Pragia fontium DSM 5563 = ATCC 49100]SUB81462.1 Transposase and inactivated derivatives [Pragia fontium]VEJ53763.1 Transposase and inactivated derivatives [Pragia fontium]
MWKQLKPTELPKCKYCEKNTHIRNHGTGKTGARRYRCMHCNKTFQTKYIYTTFPYNESNRVAM